MNAMTTTSSRSFRLSLVAALLLSGCAKPAPLNQPGDGRFAVTAPDSFDVALATTKGLLTVRVRRDWAPHGADRFFALVKNRFFDGLPFFRVVRGFVAQTGLPVDTAVAAAWRTRMIPDDSTRSSNVRGTLAFARLGPGTRSTQLFFNLADNAQLDRMNGIGFPPFAHVVDGMAVLTELHADYSTGPNGREVPTGPSQDSIRVQGDAYLRRAFPLLDRIETARVVKSW